MSWTDDDIAAPVPTTWTDDDIAPAAPPPTLGQSAARQGKLLVRALGSAALSVPSIVGDAVNKSINEVGQLVGHNPQLQMPSQMFQNIGDIAGLPRPETGVERFTQGVAETALPSFLLPGTLAAQAGGNAGIAASQAPVGHEGTAGALGAAGGAAVPVLGQALKLLGNGAAHVLGTTTGAGAESVRQAYRNAPGFVENMRGNVEPAAVVEQAKQGLLNMRQQMHDSYKYAKGGWAADTTPMSFQPVGKAFDDAVKKFSFKGVPMPGVPEVQGKVESALTGWLERARQDPAFLTVEGMDALKRHLSDIVPSDVTNRTGRAFVTEVVDGVKNAIIAEKPQYATAMRDYWLASSQLEEISRSLSLGGKATVDTALRKLQSLMRNNVNSNFGQRVASANALATQGGRDVMPAVAGQAMNSWTPRGLQGAVASGTGISGIANPVNLAALPAMSPRIVGESARFAGKVVDDYRTQAMLDALRRIVPVGVQGLIE